MDDWPTTSMLWPVYFMVLRKRSYTSYQSSIKCFTNNNIGGFQCCSTICSNLSRTAYYSFVFVIFTSSICISTADTTASGRNYLQTPENKSISSFQRVCEESNNNGTFFFNLTQQVIQEMHFDFCREISPMFSLEQNVTDSSMLLTINIANITNSSLLLPSKMMPTLNVSRYLNCNQIQKIYNGEKDIQESYCYLRNILSRSDVCSADPKDGIPHINCEDCEVWFYIVSLKDIQLKSNLNTILSFK